MQTIPQRSQNLILRIPQDNASVQITGQIAGSWSFFEGVRIPASAAQLLPSCSGSFPLSEGPGILSLDPPPSLYVLPSPSKVLWVIHPS